MAFKAVLSIILFIATYLILIMLAAALTVGFGYAGIMLILFKPAFLTLMLGLGLMSVGVFILLFLFKFITKKHTVDRSHLKEITAADEPQLFELIKDVVSEVKTPFPKKVYLSYEINAAVFYNSSFWSMIFPVRKNLQIGVGLINSVTTTELKAILAHEFGHFSQRSMKVGSYVYNVNQVIYNLLFENDSYSQILGTWARVSGYFQLFTQLAVKIIQGIQWILRKVYIVVNLNYLALSREMEFHADEVAANVTGPTPMISSLLRLALADQTFHSVLDYYGRRVDKCVKTNNVYAQHGWLMNFIGTENKMPVEKGLPYVSKEEVSRFDKSKLVIKDQWASHPSTDERITHLRNLQLPDKEQNTELASSLFENKNEIQEFFTEKLFSAVEYKYDPSITTTEYFIDDYKKAFKEGSFNDVYNGYYDNKDVPQQFVPEAEGQLNCTLSDLFSDVAVELVYTANAMEGDIALLEKIAKGETEVKSFDYNGQRYSSDSANDLVTQLSSELKELRTGVENHDRKIYNFFFQLSRQKGKEEELAAKYAEYKRVKEDSERRLELYNKMIEGTQFLQHTTPFDTIESNFENLLPLEQDLKTELNKIAVDTQYQEGLTDDIKASFNKYILNTKSYFTRPEYDQEALDILYAALNNFSALTSTVLFNAKKLLLEFQAGLQSLDGAL